MKCFSVVLFVCLKVLAVCSISDLDQQLIDAAEKGDNEKIKTLIKSGANVNAEDDKKRTPLHFAANFGHAEAIKTLIQNGANVNAEDYQQRTPLHLAAWEGNAEAIKTLIQNGANVNAEEHWKRTPLHWAAKYGHAEAIKTLIQNGANVNAEDDQKRTPLHRAAENGHAEAIKTLIENGAKVNAEDEWKQTPLHQAAKYGHAEAIKTLIQNGANVNAEDDRKLTPLHWAAPLGHAEAIKTLIQNGANVNAEDDQKQTPLHWAAWEGHAEAIKTLIQNGANVNAENNQKRTPLHLAAENGHAEAIKTLIENGANLFAEDNENKTPFQVAAKSGRDIIFTKAIQTLLENGANELANLYNNKISKEIIEAAKKKIYDEVERANSDLSNSNLTGRFNQIKQDSLKEFDGKKRGSNKISASFREQLNQDLNDFHTSLETTMQIYAHCIRNYSDSMQTSLDAEDYYDPIDLVKRHQETKSEAVAQFAKQSPKNKLAIHWNIEKVIEEKFHNFEKKNNQKRNKYTDEANAQITVIYDRIKTKLIENITRDIKNIDLNSGIYDWISLYKRSKEVAMKEFDMRKTGNKDISKNFRGKLEAVLSDFRDGLIDTMAEYQKCLNQYTNVMGNVINNFASFFNESDLMDTHKRAKNESVSEFLAKQKLGHYELNLQHKLENSIEEKCSTFAAENRRKREAFIELANLYNNKISKEIIGAAKKKIYDEVERANSDLSNSNLTGRFNQIKQDSLKEFDGKKRGENEISGGFREQLNQDLNDFHTSLETTMQIYAHCIRNYSDSMQKSLDAEDYYEQTELENLHKKTKNEAIVQFVTEAQIIGDNNAAILRNIERTIKEKFRNFEENNNEKRKKIIDKINTQNSIICDLIQAELKKNITRDIENYDLNSGLKDLIKLFKRSKEVAMKEFDMRKAGNEDISKSFRGKLEADLNDFRNVLFDTMVEYPNYLDQYSDVMGNAINSCALFLNESQLTDTHKRAKNKSLSEFLVKSKLAHEELELRFKQILEKSIEDKFFTFEAENERKKQDCIGNANLHKQLIEAAKEKICNDIRSELFDLLKFNLTGRFDQIKLNSLNEFDNKKRGQNEIASGLRENLKQDLNDFHTSLALTMKTYAECMRNHPQVLVGTRMECINFATKNAESHLFGCTNINKKEAAEFLEEMGRNNAAYPGVVVSIKV